MFKFEKLEVWQKAIARRRRFLEDPDFARIFSLPEEQGRMLSGLRRTLLGN